MENKDVEYYVNEIKVSFKEKLDNCYGNEDYNLDGEAVEELSESEKYIITQVDSYGGEGQGDDY